MNQGFSLIEVLAAGAILGVGLAATFTAYGTSTQLFEHQRHTTHGIHLTEGKLEELLLRTSSDPELQVGPTFGPEWFTSEGFASSGPCPAAVALPPLTPECRYRVTWTTTPGGVPRVRIVTVTVAWNERGVERSLTLATQRN
jgi:prepilin-type N-terminal cleavage/methylation domain-containing protein